MAECTCWKDDCPIHHDLGKPKHTLKMWWVDDHWHFDLDMDKPHSGCGSANNLEDLLKHLEDMIMAIEAMDEKPGPTMLVVAREVPDGERFD